MYDPKADGVKIDSTTGDCTQDLRIVMEGLALIMAVNRKNKKINAEDMARFVHHEIDRIASERDNYNTKNNNFENPSFLLK